MGDQIAFYASHLFLVEVQTKGDECVITIWRLWLRAPPVSPAIIYKLLLWLFSHSFSKGQWSLAPVVKKLNSAIHPADKYLENQLRYPLDRDLSITLSIFWTTGERLNLSLSLPPPLPDDCQATQEGALETNNPRWRRILRVVCVQIASLGSVWWKRFRWMLRKQES